MHPRGGGRDYLGAAGASLGRVREHALGDLGADLVDGIDHPSHAPRLGLELVVDLGGTVLDQLVQAGPEVFWRQAQPRKRFNSNAPVNQSATNTKPL